MKNVCSSMLMMKYILKPSNILNKFLMGSIISFTSR